MAKGAENYRQIFESLSEKASLCRFIDCNTEDKQRSDSIFDLVLYLK